MDSSFWALAWSIMQTTLFRIWTLLLEFISYNDNYCACKWHGPAPSWSLFHKVKPWIYIYIYIYIYIVIHRQICFILSELFNVARQARFPKLGSKPSWLKCQSKILPLSQEETSASEGNLNAHVSHLFLFTYILLTATESSIHMKSLFHPMYCLPFWLGL